MTRQTLLIVVAVALLGYTFGTCNGSAVERDSALEANAYRLAREARPKREALVRAQRDADALRTAVGRTEEGVSVVDQSLGLALDSAHIVLANVHATNADLRATIAYLIPKVDSLRSQVGVFRDSVNAQMQASLRERYAAQKLIAIADSTANAFQDLYEAEKCEIFGRECPSRKTVAVVFLAVGIVTGAAAGIVALLKP